MKIDINCDLGEGMGNDAQLMPYLDSCNIACGGHFGTKQTMLDTVQLAKNNDVKVGAHPSFPDMKNFGRKEMEISREELSRSLYKQISSFQLVCEQLKVNMHHIKLHGALYNLAAQDTEVAKLVLNAFATVKSEVKIYAPYGSAIAMLAGDYFPVYYEAFIDRRYHMDLSLVSREKPGAIIKDIKKSWIQMKTIAKKGIVKTIEGEIVSIKAQTFCLHGDEVNALKLIKYIRKCLKK